MHSVADYILKIAIGPQLWYPVLIRFIFGIKVEFGIKPNSFYF